jgi:hypothetical protein
MRERDRNLTIRLDDEELAKIHALAERGDEPISFMLRRWVRDHWRATFGDATPPATRTKFGDLVKPGARKGAQ